MRSHRPANLPYDGRKSLVLIENMVCDTAFVDFKMTEQIAGSAGVLAQDKVHRPEHIERTQGDVLQIANRSWDYKQLHIRFLQHPDMPEESWRQRYNKYIAHLQEKGQAFNHCCIIH